MDRPSQDFRRLLSPQKWGIRYSFALSSVVAVIAITLAINSHSTRFISPFVVGFASVIATAAFAGPGPGVLATVLLTVWAALDLNSHQVPLSDILIRLFFFVSEGILISLCSAHMLRNARAAASSESWHRKLVETAAEGIWVSGPDNVITYANARMAELLAVPIETLEGRKTEEFFFPPDVSVERIRAASLVSGLKEQFDRRLRRSDGTEVWVLACCNSITDEFGKSLGSLAMMTDITERKRAEHALRRSETRFRGLFDTLFEGVYQSTPEGRILAANPTLLKMLGFANEGELNDVHIAKDLYVDAGIRRRLLDQLENDGSFQNIEYELRRRDGTIITVLENARVIRDDNGAVLYYEGTLTDITNRKRIEEQLRQAQKVEALGRLAGGIANDFDKVLNVIQGYAGNALRELAPDHPAYRPTESALDAANSATALIAQLIAFSRHPDDSPLPQPLQETILLLEHEPLLRELSRDMLERQGYRVLLASSTAEAERVGAAETRLDLLVTAAEMPGAPGRELVRKLLSAHPKMKVLYVAGYDEPSVDADKFAGNGTALVQRPFSAESMGRSISQLLDRR